MLTCIAVDITVFGESLHTVRDMLWNPSSVHLLMHTHRSESIRSCMTWVLTHSNVYIHVACQASRARAAPCDCKRQRLRRPFRQTLCFVFIRFLPWCLCNLLLDLLGHRLTLLPRRLKKSPTWQVDRPNHPFAMQARICC